MPSRLSSLLCLLVVFFVAFLVDQSAGSSYRSYKAPTQDDSTKREALALLSRLVEIVKYGGLSSHFVKRNGGTTDTLYNIPDLMDIGRRR